MLRDSFLLFTEQIELLEQLTDEQAGKLIKSIYHYAQTGEEENLDPMSRLVFTSMRQDLDRNAQKYEEKRQKMSENGRKGGRPKKDESAVGQALPDNSSDLTNNLYGNKLLTSCILSSEGEENGSLTTHDSPLTNKKGVGQALPDNKADKVTDEEREIFTNSYDEEEFSGSNDDVVKLAKDFIRMTPPAETAYGKTGYNRNITYRERYERLKLRENSC